MSTTPMRRQRPRKLIAMRLKGLRKAVGLSHEATAKALRIARPQWSQIECGASSVPYERVNDLAKLFNCTAVDILGPVA